ncbi:hypothetical protein BDB01DRAFT_853124 [Pilobolus umbonatus]|nr:hypothetical protein BDB01DRAFT_853124 [Pilobolus umbonatus]
MESFWVVCVEDGCHCDWRVTIEGCLETKAMFAIYLMNVICSCLLLLLGGYLLYMRLAVKKEPLFDPQNKWRPRPIESMMVLGNLFNLLRIIDGLILITDTLPNPIIRSVLYEIPWQFGLAAFSCYLFGISHIVSKSVAIFRPQEVISSDRLVSISIATIFLPFITNNIFSVLAAVYAEQGDYRKAKIYTDTLYYLWSAYCLNLACWTVFSGYRLILILNKHIEHQSISNNNNLTLIRVSHDKFIYGSMRVPIMTHTIGTHIMALIWTFDGTISAMFIMTVLIHTPKAYTSYDEDQTNQTGQLRDYSRGRIFNQL